MVRPGAASACAQAVVRGLGGLILFVTGPWTLRNGLAWLKLIALLLVILWVGVQPFTIPSGSMEPTLHGDRNFFRADRVLVDKIRYGPRVPFTNVRLFPLAKPQRWDMVVFRSVDKETPRRVLVKRIVGLPGERVHIADGTVYANGEVLVPPQGLVDVLHYTTQLEPTEDEVRGALLRHGKANQPHGLLNPANETVQALYADFERLHQKLGEREVDELSDADKDALLSDVAPISFNVMRQLLTRERNDVTPFVFGVLPEDEFSRVPDDSYFVLGDNSAQSIDGRNFGWVPNDRVLGRVFCICWPIGRWRDFTGFSATWWGRCALYGCPILIVLYEVLSTFVLASYRVREVAADDVLRRGDRVLVNRLAFGMAWPPLRGRFGHNRIPRPGEIVAYRGANGALLLGRVEGLLKDGSGAPRESGTETQQQECVLSRWGDSHSLTAVNRGDLVGSVSAVWWPIWRWRGARRIQVNLL